MKLFLYFQYLSFEQTSELLLNQLFQDENFQYLHQSYALLIQNRFLFPEKLF